MTRGAATSRIKNVQLQDGILTWIYVDDHQQQQQQQQQQSDGRATIDQILFTVKKPAQQSSTSSSSSSSSSSSALPPPPPPEDGFVICSLTEDEDDSRAQQRPFFSLRLLSTAVVPDALLRRAPVLSLGDDLPDHLRATPDNRIDVIVSTRSGTGRAQPFWRHVLRPLLRGLLLPLALDDAAARATAAATDHQAPEPWDVLTTQDEQTVRRYARTLDHQSSPRRTIILISGDGGIVDLLNGRGPTPPPPPPPRHLLALLPLGTANALFHSLHRPLETSPGPTPLVLALRTLFLGTPRDLPMFKALFTPGSHIVSYTSATDEQNSNHDAASASASASASLTRHDTAVSFLYGAIVASYALHASIVHESDTPAYRLHGSTRFGMVARRLLQESHAYRASVEVETAAAPSASASASASPTGATGEPRPRPDNGHETTHGYVLVSMVSNLERTFTISPQSRPLDGKLHLVRFGAVGPEKVMQAMTAAYDGGRHTALEWPDGDRVLYEEVRAVRVLTQEEEARWRKFCVDGTIVEVERGGGMRVEPVPGAAFRVLVDGRAVS
ncbi:hypothetical protein E4U41_004679 [Claviceps citrina]|nr:hypothetical protein E4U41_004679 [Claviceps citrina]